MEAIKAWYRRQLSEGTFNIRYLILWFMAAVFPLLVIPHPFYITFALGIVPPNCLYLPRYVILGVVALIALIILLKDRTTVNHPAFIPLALFIIFATISGLLAPVQMTAWIGSPFRFTGLTTYYFCIILFILAYKNRKTEQLLAWLAYTATIVSVVAILQYFGLNLVPYEASSNGGIGFGTMPHSNFLGTYMAFILPAAIFLFLRTKKAYNLIFPALIFAGLLVSQCRGAWIAALAGFILITWYVWKKPEMRKAFLALSGALLLAALIVMLTQQGIVLDRLLSLQGSTGINLNDTAGSYRMYIWRGAWHLFLLYWPFGIGPDHLVYGNLITPAREVADKVHNIYLEMGLTMGAFSLLSYLAFLGFCLRRWTTETGFVLFTMIVVYLIQGLTNIDIVAIMPLFWIVLGAALAERSFGQ
jgi:putative inorganic carbon (HCO3(-)) transporter